MSKNIIVITGGAGFVGSNLILHFLKNTKYKIISIDNYSSGSKKKHIKDKRIKYIHNDTKNISIILKKQKKKIHSFFILVNLQEYIKALIKWTNALNQIQ